MRGVGVLPALLISWLWWNGCSGAPDAEGPRETLDRYFAAARAGDWESFYQVVGSEYRAGRTPAEFSAWARSATPDFVREMTARTTYEVVGVEVDGDRATAKLRLQVPDLRAIPGLQGRLPTAVEIRAAPLVPADQNFDLLREEGEWRVHLIPPEPPDPELIERLQRATGAFVPPPDPTSGDQAR